jgi:outer membrane protein assembly factor BamB
MSRGRLRVATTLCLVAILGTIAHAQWPQFRGPNGSGIDNATGYPTEFSPTRNVAWKTAVPFGQSSPVIVGDRLYLTASEGDHLLTLAVSARSGKELWRRDVKRERADTRFKANDAASPTPAADDQGVVAFFADFGLVAYAPDGTPRWSSRLGPFQNFYGMSVSPVIADGLVVLVCDQTAGSFAVALDRATGKERWKVDRPRVGAAWSTPVVFRPDKAHADLVVLGTYRIDAYDLATGKARWWLPFVSVGSLGTPVVHGDTVIVSALGSAEPFLPVFAGALAQYDTDKDGRLSRAEFQADKEFAEHFGYIDENADGFIGAAEWDDKRSLGVGEFGAVAIRPGDTTGRLPPTAVRWRFGKNIPYIPAPLLYRDVFYMVKTGGIITSVDAATGKLLKEGRSPDALGEYIASPVAADGKVFLASEDGKISVLTAGAQWAVLGVNDLGEEIHATPALAGGRIYVRTRSTLYSFGAR